MGVYSFLGAGSNHFLISLAIQLQKLAWRYIWGSRYQPILNFHMSQLAFQIFRFVGLSRFHLG